MGTETTQEAAHKHGFPCNPPGGTFGNPGPCECGKTYTQGIADTLLAEALAAVAAAYGVPPRVSEQWAVAWGGNALNDGTGFVEPYDDEEDARDHLEFYAGSQVVRRTVIALRWEVAPAAGDAAEAEAAR